MCGIMLRAMPNWSYILINALYHVGLALWIGGAIALGALAAPVLFQSLPRQQAGSIFGPTLRRFARLRVLALVFIVVGAGCKFLFYESHAAIVWIANSCIARPTCVGRLLSTLPPAVGV